MKLQIFSYKLQFIQAATTSRGSMDFHQVYYIQISDGIKKGIGEAGPLKGLSTDYNTIKDGLKLLAEYYNDGAPVQDILILLNDFPSAKFAFETALYDYNSGGRYIIYDTPFTSANTPIETNGLVWMADSKTMLDEAFKKAEAGFTTIKFKVGSLDFDEECRMIEQLRRYYNSWKITIRLDANGAFANNDALEKLKELKRFDIHSIEQPIKAGHWDLMEELVSKTPIDIALDEELIGVNVYNDAEPILKKIKPHYIILKPTLLGGFTNCEAWVKLAEKYSKGWWSTSALESNIGLNAIAQWASKYKSPMPQGLGTGLLYNNNLLSPLLLHDGHLLYNPAGKWGDLETLEAIEKEA
ncbi:MAG: o-succinylbenzoate synthase [Bacteroidota bacterium]|nr:o-succinylbenzoate synthase [Bacteroidota bacterium]